MSKEGEQKTNYSGIAGVVLGIQSIVFSSLSGVILGIVGLIFSIKQRKYNPNSWSKAGIILNIIGIILSIATVVAGYYYISNSQEIQAQLQQQIGALSAAK